jgi:acyl carrier protein
MNDASQPPAAALQGRLLGLIRQILDKGLDYEVPPDARLSERGMSSIKMVNLMLALEGEFDLSIPQADITPENFRSLHSIEQLVERLLRLKA